jgi:hypothetical protein
MPESTISELRPEPIRATIALLARRVAERFPASGLCRVAAELVHLAERNECVIERLRRPLWWLRGLIALAIGAVVAVASWAAVQFVRLEGGIGGVADLLQGLDAAINELIFLGLALLFLTSMESRVKRRTALRMLHRLRSIAHVIDMHQLTKTPEYALRSVEATASSPVRTFSRGQLGRYLDYCSEMLALISKLAALHTQHLQDPVVLAAVNDVESLATGLARQIWQKITILDVASLDGAPPANPVGPTARRDQAPPPVPPPGG